MSYESTIGHLREQLAAGTTRRRRIEQRRRRATLATGALCIVLTLVSAVAMARRPSDDSERSRTTAGTTLQQKAVCEAFLDYLGATETLRDLAPFASRVRELAGVLPAGDPIGDPGRRIGERGDDPDAIDAWNQLQAACRAGGHPDFNPVYVPADVPPAPSVTIEPGWEQQPLRGTATLPDPPRVSVARGGYRELSTVRLAVSDEGALIAAWEYTRDDQRVSCIGYAAGNGGGANCGRQGDDQLLGGNEVQILSAGQGKSVSLAVSDAVTTVVVSNGTQTVVQQPALTRAVIVWRTSTNASTITVRAYDRAGTLIGCVAGSGSC